MRREVDFSKPGSRVVGRLVDGNLHCPRCGCGDLGAVCGGDSMCNFCNAVVAYPKPQADKRP